MLGGLVTVIAAAMLIRRAASRRLLVTLALPAYFYVFDGVYGSSFVPYPPPAYLLPLALLPLAVILMSLRWYRRRRRRAPADGQAPSTRAAPEPTRDPARVRRRGPDR